VAKSLMGEIERLRVAGRRKQYLLNEQKGGDD
jgi:hypothetical protein